MSSGLWTDNRTAHVERLRLGNRGRQRRSTVEIEAEEVAASLRFATVAITKAGAADEAQDQGEEVPV